MSGNGQRGNHILVHCSRASDLGPFRALFGSAVKRVCKVPDATTLRSMSHVLYQLDLAVRCRVLSIPLQKELDVALCLYP